MYNKLTTIEKYLTYRFGTFYMYFMKQRFRIEQKRRIKEDPAAKA
jgi:hypothetical protein